MRPTLLPIGVIGVLALLCSPGCARRKALGEQELAAAKEAYQQAVSSTGDFDCATSACDEALRLLDAVPNHTPSKREAKALADQIRRSRSTARGQKAAIDKSTADVAEVTRTVAAKAAASRSPGPGGPGAEGSASIDPKDKAACKAAKKWELSLQTQRLKSGKPNLNQMIMLPDSTVGLAPGAEATDDERTAHEQVRICAGLPAKDPSWP